MAPRPLDLTSRINALRRFFLEEHRSPTFEEMVKLFNYKSKNSVSQVVTKLERLGYVQAHRPPPPARFHRRGLPCR